jgi:hypothetical protein
MPMDTLMVKKKIEIVAKYSQQGDKIIIIVPKAFHETINKFKNPLRVTIEEILE